MELSSTDYEEAFHYSPKRNYTGAIYEYCQRQNTLPSFALIPGPIGGERLFTVQLHLNGLRTIGLARTVKAARHRASENMLRSFRACAFVKNLFMSCTTEKKKLVLHALYEIAYRKPTPESIEQTSTRV